MAKAKKGGAILVGAGKAIATAALAAVTAAVPIVAVQAEAPVNSAKTISVRESAIEAQVAPAPVTDNKKLISGRIHRYKTSESRFLNQRQYRKKCRQNPCLYRSKKHRSKN